MNKKNYIAVGAFVLLIAIGGGIAYYFDPVAINSLIGIDNAQIDTVSDADLSAIDSASSSFPVDDSQTGIDSAAPTPTSAQKTSQKKSSAVAIAPTGAPTAITENDEVTSTSLSSASNTIDDASDTATMMISTSSCPFPVTAPSTTTKKLIFNEIAWMGSPTSSTAEWMEIKNISTGTIDLSGWELLNASGKIKISFSVGDVITSGGFQILSRGSAPASASATQIYSGDLVNTGDMLAIMDPQCDVSDYLDASHGWPGGNNTTKQTLERDADGIGWHTSALPGGTPGAENSAGAVATSTPAPTPAAQSPISITPNIPTAPDADEASSGNADTNASASAETVTNTPTSLIASAPETGDGAADSGSNSNSTASITPVLIAAVQTAGASSSNDFIRLYNPTASAIDMSGWKLHKRSSTGTDYSIKVFPTGSAVAAGQSFTWANSTDGFSETIGANVSSTETLAADNSVALMDATGNIIDAVAWGTGTDQYGEGPPYPTSPDANQLLSRRSSGGVMVDTDNNTNDFILQ
ncbi:MAG TPA: lamin tail domain-containing protein [Candidatus Paceibacterota bacterium]